MLKFNYKQKINERIKAKCAKHPRYNPEREGRGGVKGGCTTCWQLYDLYQARVRLDAAVGDFLRRAVPWSAAVKRRAKAASQSAETTEPSGSTQPGGSCRLGNGSA
jgi:hypothetical protein